MCVMACPNQMPAFKDTQSSTPFSLKDLIGDGILWAVPKHRKPLEARLKAKYGHSKYRMKIYRPKTTLRICTQCGHDHEVGVLCRKCSLPEKIFVEKDKRTKKKNLLSHILSNRE